MIKVMDKKIFENPGRNKCRLKQNPERKKIEE